MTCCLCLPALAQRLRRAEVPVVPRAEVPVVPRAEVPVVPRVEVPVVLRAEVPIVPRVEVPVVIRAEVPVNGFRKGGVIVSVGTTGVGATNAAPTPKLAISRDPSGIPVLPAVPMAVGDVGNTPEVAMIDEAEEALEAIELQLFTTVAGVDVDVTADMAAPEVPLTVPDEVPPMDVSPDEVPPMDVTAPRPPPSKLEKVEVSAVIPGVVVPRPEHPIAAQGARRNWRVGRQGEAQASGIEFERTKRDTRRTNCSGRPQRDTRRTD